MVLDPVQPRLYVGRLDCYWRRSLSLGARFGALAMLERLVMEIQNGGTFETGMLAARLGVSPQLVQAMLEHLQRSGLIHPYINCDRVDCQGCGLHDACGSPALVRLWQSKPED